MAIKINHKIVNYHIKKPEPPQGVPTSSREFMHEEIKRPDELKGYTYKIKTPLSDHALYITINNIVLNADTEHEQEYPFEVFINSKNMEHFQWVLALTRVISAVFRKGGDATFMVDELKEVFDPQGGYFKRGGRFMPSLVAEIGDVLEKHMKKSGLLKREQLSTEYQALLAEKHQILVGKAANTEDPTELAGYPPGAQLCPKCNTLAVIQMDGCMTCLACGDSKCG